MSSTNDLQPSLYGLPPEKRERCFLTRDYCPLLSHVERLDRIKRADRKLLDGAKKEGAKYILKLLRNPEIETDYIETVIRNITDEGGTFIYEGKTNRRITDTSDLEKETDEKEIVLEEGIGSLISDDIPSNYKRRLPRLED